MAESDAGASNTRPGWLAVLEDDLYIDSDIQENGALLEILKCMLLQSDSDRKASDDAAEKLAGLFQNDLQQSNKESTYESLKLYFSEWVELVFVLIESISFSDPLHGRCAMLFTALRELGNVVFNAPSEISFIKAFQEGIGAKAEQAWNASQLPLIQPESPREQQVYFKRCKRSLSVETFLARLYQSHVLDDYGLKYATIALESAFGTDKQDAASITRQPYSAAYAREIAVQYIILAKEAIIADLAADSNAQWRQWRQQLKNIADGSDQDVAGLGYKAHAFQAYQRLQ